MKNLISIFHENQLIPELKKRPYTYLSCPKLTRAAQRQPRPIPPGRSSLKILNPVKTLQKLESRTPQKGRSIRVYGFYHLETPALWNHLKIFTTPVYIPLEKEPTLARLYPFNLRLL